MWKTIVFTNDNEIAMIFLFFIDKNTDIYHHNIGKYNIRNRNKSTY